MTTASKSLNVSLRRSRALIVVLLVAIVATMAILAQSAAASSSDPFEGSGSFTPQIINGKESSISEFPWQVFVLSVVEKGGGSLDIGSCGGSILSSTTILTAAHCVTEEETTTPESAGDLLVVAGASFFKGNVLVEAIDGIPHSEEEYVSPTTAQARSVTSFRVHPDYTPLTAHSEVKDDVAVLTLKTPLEISAEKHTGTIGLVAPSATPAAGTTLTISGYGLEQGNATEEDGKLFSTTLTAIGSDECREGVKLNSAVLLCAGSTTSSTCQGDSGGPLTEGNPAVQVGIVDFGAKECPVGVPDVFTNIAAPEIRDFIEGSESPPVAARLTSPAPSIKSVGPAPVALGPLTCEPGGWSGSPTFSYTFKAESSSAHQVLQSGSSNTFTPPTSLVGTPIVCVVQASNPGGVSTERSATTSAIATDPTPPTLTLGALSCAKNTPSCTLPFTVTDPSGVAISGEQAKAAYSVVTKCPPEKKSKKGKKGKKGKKNNKPEKPKVCHTTKTVPMAVTAGATSGAFQTSLGGLPYSEPISFTVEASNAAGLKAEQSTGTTLPKPKPKPKHKKKPKKKKKKH